MSTPSSNKKLVLTQSSEWDLWISYVQARSVFDGIWPLINPNLPAKPFRLEEPTTPTLQISSTGVITPDALTLHKAQTTEYKLLLAKYEKQQKALKEIVSFIQESISTTNGTLIERVNLDPYDMLVALKQRLAPTTRATKLAIEQDYHRICKGPKNNQDVERWMDEWVRIYMKAKDFKFFEIDEDRPVRDFLLAMEPVEPNLVAASFLELERSPDTQNILKTVEQFRNILKFTSYKKRKHHEHSAFAATDENDNDNENDKDKPSFKGNTQNPPKCLCGKMHWYGDCYYLNPDKRPAGWKLNARIIKLIEEAMKDKGMKEKVERSIKFRKESEAKNSGGDGRTPASTNPFAGAASSSSDSPEHQFLSEDHFIGAVSSDPHHGAFPVRSFSASEYSLATTWILDHGSDVHICNDSMKDRFIKERDAKGEIVIAGTQKLQIEAYGSIKVYFKSANGEKNGIRLANVRYISNFMTNIVSGSILASKGLHFDTQHARLHQEGNTVGYASFKNGHYIMEDEDFRIFIGKSTKSKSINAASSMAFSGKTPMAAPSSSMILTTNSANDWHQILAHAGNDAIQNLEAAVRGIKISGDITVPKTNECETCALSKAHQQISKSAEKSEYSDKPFHRVTYDLIPLNTAMNKDQWISHFACSTTNFNLVFTHRQKSEATAIIRKAFNIISTRFEGKVVFFRSDGETSLGKDFENLISKFGITHEPSAPYTPQQNGHSERIGGVLIMKARTLRIGANLPNSLWPWIVRTAGYIMNRTPMKKLNWKTPYELVIGAKPDLSHMHKFGCKAYPLEKSIPKKEKLRERAHVGFLLGYDSTNIYNIWIPSQHKVIRTRDVMFDDSAFYNPSEPDIYQAFQEPVEESSTFELPSLQNGHMISTLDSDSESDENEIISPATPKIGPNLEAYPPLPDSPDDKFEDSYETLSPHLPTPHLPTPESESAPSEDKIDKISSRSRRYAPAPPAPRDINSKIDETNILPEGVSRSRRRARKQLHALAVKDASSNFNAYHKAFSCFSAARNYYSSDISSNINMKTSDQSTKSDDSPQRFHRNNLPPEPLNWKQMLKHPHCSGWMKAVDIEFDQLTRKEVWKIIQANRKEPGKIAIPTTWVFRYKFDEDGFLTKYKARLCARGDKQYTQADTFAATLAIRIFRALMALVAAFDLETRQYDVLNAFINSSIDEPTYCIPPDGWKNAEGILLLLLRALYGLKQSPALWYKNLSTTLTNLGLEPIPGVDCLFANDSMVVFFFVDDIVVIFDRRHAEKVNEFQAKLFEAYEMRYLGELQWFLGIRIARDRTSQKLWLCQDSYIEKLISKFNVDISTKAPGAPLSYYVTLLKNPGQASPEEILSYQQRIGSVNFSAVITRPDIAFAASKLSEFLINPSSQHIEAANGLLRYLAHTKEYVIEYDGEIINSNTIFLVSSDAAFADDLETRYSSQGYCFKLFGGLIDWKASKQRTVTTSSTEAELLAVSNTGKELLWWNRFFEAIDFHLNMTPHIQCDNRQTIRAFTNEPGQFSTKLRHVDVHRHWLRQEVQKASILIRWTPSLKVIADGLTKALPPQRHQEFINLLGLKRCPLS